MQPKPQHKKNKHLAKPQYKNVTAFKSQEKHYKLYQGHQTDFSKLFVPTQQDFVQVQGFQVCQLPFPQGAYYVKNFTPYEKVIEIGYFGLNQYWKRPYRTNLDSRQQLYEKNNEQEEKAREQKKAQLILQQKTQKRQQNEQDQRKQIQIQNKEEGTSKFYFNQKIRWANVGYQYDWTLRQYPQMKTPIHFTIQQLSDKANSLYNSIQHTKKNYEPQSAIINYYGVKDYMTGHLDDAQIDQQSPIYSFSFGLSCIFLIGGRTKEEEPTGIQLNSGDLLIMAGQSRKCYHGVPRILENSFKNPSQQMEQKGKEQVKIVEGKVSKKGNTQTKLNNYLNVKQYLKGHRININIRQVYPRN